jgi:hypothetical protein
MNLIVSRPFPAVSRVLRALGVLCDLFERIIPFMGEVVSARPHKDHPIHR